MLTATGAALRGRPVSSPLPFALSSGILGIAIVAGIACYPMERWPLALALIAYAALLWIRPAAFLLVVPFILPALDLGLWTGWMMVGESDLFLLTTVAVLLLRDPPGITDLLPFGISRMILSVLVACWIVATLVGLFSTFGAAHSDNVFLRPDNALRLAKSLLEALLLLPFLRQRQRVHGDAILRLGWGVIAGLGAVALIVVAERILFAGIGDFSSDYRVAGPFSSMRVGGGHIGAYAALVLPFSLCLLQLKPRRLGTALAVAACVFGSYVIAVTFARAAYAATFVAIVITCAGCVFATRGRHRRSAALGIVPAVLVLLALAGAAAFTGMHQRFAASALDFLTRQDNWRAGLAVRDRGAVPTVFGMGLGTYQRAMLSRSTVNRPSDLVFGREDGGTFVSLRVETPFFLGQKIQVPSSGALHLSLQARALGAPGMVGVVVCDKVLLYSDNCRGADAQLTQPDRWQPVEATIPIDGLGAGALGGLLHRPVEFSVYGSPGHRIDVRDIVLTDGAGRRVLLNSGFEHGLDRWIFTDDSHVSWRMLNQYLMLFFETGALGLAAFAALCGLAVAGGVRALCGGDIGGAAVAGSIAGFLVSCLFDNVLEAPRVATLFFLVCWCGLLQWEAKTARPD